MNIDTATNLFEMALQLEKPWFISNIDLNKEQKKLNITLDFPRGSVFRCSKCGCEVKAYDTEEKTWRHMNFFQYECYLKARVPRLNCSVDGIHQVELPWARSGSSFTLLFEALLFTLSGEMPVQRVADLVSEDDEKIWRMLHHYVHKARESEDYYSVSKIGMDETSMKKNHNYVTIAVDLEKKRTIFVTDGKDSAAVEKFEKDYTKHGGLAENVTQFSIDMSPAFIKGVTENFPNAEIVFDKFHIIKIINEALDKVRRSEVSEQSILRNMKYLFLKNRANLDQAQRDYLEKIESMPSLNLKTIRAYHIRENFQEIYKEQTAEQFENSLKRWYWWASHSRIEPMVKAAATIKGHWNGVLKWFEHKINNGILEGLNSLIQTAKAKARGFRTLKNFSTIIYMITGKLNFEQFGFTHTI
jgi:transposase